MIFVSGIHGVGKTYFCNIVEEKLGIKSYSASQLIAEKRIKGFPVDKLVSDIDENQLFLLTAIDELRKKEEEFILDGHFCLLDKEGIISRISMDTYTALKPNKIILLTEQPSIVVARRFQRDGITMDENIVSSFQREEIAYANEVAEYLDIPLIISSGNSDLEKVLKNIEIGGI